MGLMSKYKERQEKKLKEHEDRLKEIDEFNFQAMCRAGGFTEEEGRKVVEENISKGRYKFHLEDTERNIKKPIGEKKVCCPKCGSTQLTANKKGYSLGKAIAGGVITLTPIVGVATGLIGKNKIIITCLNCGKQFEPGKR